MNRLWPERGGWLEIKIITELQDLIEGQDSGAALLLLTRRMTSVAPLKTKNKGYMGCEAGK